MVYSAAPLPPAKPVRSLSRAVAVGVATGAVLLCVSVASFASNELATFYKQANSTVPANEELSTTTSQGVDAKEPQAMFLSTTDHNANTTAPAWLSLDETSKGSYVPDVCSPEVLAQIMNASGCGNAVGASFTTASLEEHGVSALCDEAPRDQGGVSVNNGNVDQRAKIGGMVADGIVPDVEQYVPNGGVRRLQANGTAAAGNGTAAAGTTTSTGSGPSHFDVDLYLQASNGRERQHRLLCMMEATQEAASAEGVQDDALGRLNAYQDAWKPVLRQQQAACGKPEFTGNGSKTLRTCLRGFSDADAVSLLQCRAKATDTRTLFEVRDFMCLHHNRVSRDVFYTRLQGNAAQLLDAQRYSEYESKTDMDIMAQKKADQMYNLKKTFDMIADKDAEIQNISATTPL